MFFKASKCLGPTTFQGFTLLGLHSFFLSLFFNHLGNFVVLPAVKPIDSQDDGLTDRDEDEDEDEDEN